MSPSWACPVNRAHIKRPLDGQLWNRHSVSVSERSPSYRESNKGSKESRDQLWASVLQRCPSYRESNKGSTESQGPTLGVRLTEVSVLERVK